MDSSTKFFFQDSSNLDGFFPRAPTITLLNQVGGLWFGGHAVPVCVASASGVILVVRALAASAYVRRLFLYLGLTNGSDDTSRSVHASYVQAHGGRIIFYMEIMRLFGCFGLLYASVARFLILQGPAAAIAGITCIVFTYSTLLALVVVFYPRLNPTVSRHLTTVLASSWMVYFVRNVIPLMTYTQHPADPPYMLWELISVLSFTAVVLPLVTPSRYVPFDASDPKPPTPEQTVSPLSLLFFSFLDAMVWKAYRVPHLPVSDLPPLADSDLSKNLVRIAFPYLDPYPDSKLETKDSIARGHKRSSRPRSVFRAISFVFRKEAVVIVLVLLVHTVTTLLAPYGLKKLLEYLGNGGKGAIIRPWVWIASLFLAPFTATLMLQQYQKVLTRVAVRLEAILTQLILQHALRMRAVVEGVSEEQDGANTRPASNSNSSVALSEHGESEHRETTPLSIAVESTTTSPPAPARKSLVGRMNNLISSDLQAIVQGAEFVQVFFAGPILIALTMGFLYTILGWSALVGFGVLLLQMPIPALLTRWLQGSSRELAKRRDDRVEVVTETMSVIRMIKMFGWEKRMSAQIDEKREAELVWVWWNKVYSLYTMCFNFFIPAVTMSSTFAVYALAMKRNLDAATVFSAIALFDILRQQTLRFFMLVPLVVKGQVSLQRISEFLENTALLDDFSADHEEEISNDPQSNTTPINEIGFRAAAFSWSSDTVAGGAVSSKRRFRLQISDELIFKRGCINLIIGPTGSGKTSLLMALLGEMHFLPQSPQGSWFNLPRGGGVAYAAQESWVTNSTIRENILFTSPYNEERYKNVIHQCALTRDLELFTAGDRTEVGERGLTLSGGQKARITLARAVYSSAEILLLDDVFAALDVHTTRWIVDKCFRGELVRGRTVLLVTHNINMVVPISDFVVSLGSDGRVVSQGTISDALGKNPSLELEIAKEIQNEETVEFEGTGSEQGNVQKEAGGKLILKEEMAEGRVGWDSVKMYFVALGGRRWILFWAVFTTAAFFERTIDVIQPWLLGEWATQYQKHPPEEVNVSFYLAGYVGLAFLMLFVFSCNQMTLTYGALRASNSLHRRLIDAVLGTTLRWLDKTPISRVILRATQDIAASKSPSILRTHHTHSSVLVDTTLPDLFSHLFEIGVILAVRFMAILFYAPAAGTLGLVVFVIGGVLGNVYMQSQLAVKREMSRAKAPVVAHFGMAVEGLVSIRAYGAQEAVLSQSLNNIDGYTRCARVFNDLARWIGIRVDALGGLFAASLGWYFVYAPSTGVSTSNSAFTLAMAVGFGRMVLIFVQVLNMFEVNGNSLERLQQYMAIEQEQEQHTHSTPPVHWPSSGALRVEGLSAQYTPNGADVLHDLSFTIAPGERVGVVGRTGSGKSTLALALLRCVPVRGEVYLDGLQTSALDLDTLRSRVTVVPQMAELLSGSVRRNLDPFGEFNDAVLSAALRDAGLYAMQDGNERRIWLDSIIAREGGNLSVGQRQIVALARAMVRNNKLLILDEATSAIDYKTDAVIQQSLRNQIKDVTVITVAHRLQGIMDYDRIMVLDAGRIVEFDRPAELLRNEGGYFRTLVDESGDRNALYTAADASN